ncbi:hypothetical protein B0T21DRAFT_413030 [Apiosordaria backusii]|uniref:Zn(2)-C6 fungal-type domain-containing protein n=1 Tax=Apiosordaria backusii TaxID=314023 RepID=A0AA40BET5_9PEZI|nr:hypothetical protein B0T21DRAFT_413030 [Apiosordaria backusii]
MPLPGFPFTQSWGFLSLAKDAPSPEEEGDSTSPSTLGHGSSENNAALTSPQETDSHVAETPPNTDAGPNTVVIHDDPESDDDEVLDITKALRAKASLRKPSPTTAASGPPAPGSLAAEAQNRPAPRTSAILRGLGWLTESSDAPTPGSDRISMERSTQVSNDIQTGPDEGIPPRAIQSSLQRQQERQAAKKSKEEKQLERQKIIDLIKGIERRQREGTQAFDDRRRQGSTAPSSRVEVVDLRSPTSVVTKARSVAASSPSRHSRRKREERRRRKEQKSARAGRGANSGALTVESLEETGTSGVDADIFLLTKRVADASSQKPRTQIVTGLESGDVQREYQGYMGPQAQAELADIRRPLPSVPSRIPQTGHNTRSSITAPSRARKCDRCTRMKRPCTYGQPCSRCQIAGVECVYFHNNIRPPRAEPPENQQRITTSRPSNQTESFVDQQYRLSLPQPGFQEPSMTKRQPRIRQPPQPPRSPSYSPSPEPDLSPVDAVPAIDMFGPDQMVQQYVVYRTQKLPIDHNEDPEETRSDYAVRCSEHSKLLHANQQVLARLNKPKKGVMGRSWKYRPGLDEGQVPGLADGRVEYSTGEGVYYDRKKYDVWSVVVVKREDPEAMKVERKIVFECQGEQEDEQGVSEAEEQVEVNTEVQEVEAEVEVEMDAEGDTEMGGENITAETSAETAGESQLAGTTQAATETQPKKDLPWWHHDYYADSDDDENDDDNAEDNTTSPAEKYPYNPPPPIIIPQGTNALDLLSITPTHHSSYTRPNLANIAALEVFLSLTEPKNNYMDDNIHYNFVLKPPQEFEFEKAGLDNAMTRQLFNVIWRPPGNTNTAKYKWEFEEVRVWVEEGKLEGPIDLSDFVVEDGEKGGYFVNKGKKKEVGRAGDVKGKGKAVEQRDGEDGRGVWEGEGEGEASEEE